MNPANCECPCALIDPNVTIAGWKELASIWPSSEQFDAAIANNANNARKGKLKMNGGRRTRRLKGGARRLAESFIVDEPNKARIIKSLQNATYVGHLGDGSFGSVDLVQLNARTYAVKKTMTYPINDCRMDTLVEREIAVMADLTRNPLTRTYVPTFIGALYYDNDPDMIERIFCCKKTVEKTVEIFMYYIRGDTLHNISNNAIQRRNTYLSITFMEQLIPKLFAGIQQIHAAGYVHCDIKPQNIFITDDWNPVFIDFGGTIREGERFEFGTVEFLPRLFADSMLYNFRVKPLVTRDIDIYGLEKSIYSTLFILRAFVLNQGRYVHPNNRYIAPAYFDAARRRFPGRRDPPANYQWQNVVLPPDFGQTMRRMNEFPPSAPAPAPAPAPVAPSDTATSGITVLRQRRPTSGTRKTKV
jgi:serine/threonine protein kinase